MPELSSVVGKVPETCADPSWLSVLSSAAHASLAAAGRFGAGDLGTQLGPVATFASPRSVVAMEVSEAGA